MIGFFKGLFSALLEFLYGLSTKNVEAVDADPTAGGIKRRFLERMRQHRDSGATTNPDSTCGTGGSTGFCCPKRRNES